MKKIFFLDFRFNIELIKNIVSDHAEYVPPGYENATRRHKATIHKQLQNSSFKSFLHDNELAFSMYNYKKEPKDRLYFHRLEKKAFSYNVYVMLPQKNNFLYSTLDRKIRQFVEGGFFVHCQKLGIELDFDDA